MDLGGVALPEEFVILPSIFTNPCTNVVISNIHEPKRCVIVTNQYTTSGIHEPISNTTHEPISETAGLGTSAECETNEAVDCARIDFDQLHRGVLALQVCVSLSHLLYMLPPRDAVCVYSEIFHEPILSK